MELSLFSNTITFKQEAMYGDIIMEPNMVMVTIMDIQVTSKTKKSIKFDRSI